MYALGCDDASAARLCEGKSKNGDSYGDMACMSAAKSE